jgi:hypothetical protein
MEPTVGDREARITEWMGCLGFKPGSWKVNTTITATGTTRQHVLWGSVYIYTTNGRVTALQY